MSDSIAVTDARPFASSQVLSDDDDDDDEVVSLEELDNPGSSEDDKKLKRLRGADVKHTSTTTDTEGDETQPGLVLSTDTEGDRRR